MIAFSTAWLIILNRGMNFYLVLCKCFISANSLVYRVEGMSATVSVNLCPQEDSIWSRLQARGMSLLPSQCGDLASFKILLPFHRRLKSFQKRRNQSILVIYYWNHFAWGHWVQFSLNGWFTFFLLHLCVMTLFFMRNSAYCNTHSSHNYWWL